MGVRGIINIIITTILAALIGVGIYACVCEKLAGNSVPMPFGVGAVCVLSGSMEPSYSVGDLLILHEEEEYIAGDTVCYQTTGTPVVHRIIFADDEEIICQGDANNTADPAISPAAIKGKVTYAIPLIGYLALWLKTPAAILLIAIVAIIIIEISFRRAKREKNQELDAMRDEIERLRGDGMNG